MKILKTLLQADAYKLLHKDQYPDKIETIYSHLTPRGTNVPDIEHVVVFGTQRLVKKLINDFEEFFRLDESQVDKLLETFSMTVRELFNYDQYEISHWKDLWVLGKLPLNINSIEEGSVIPFRVPVLTIWNTNKEFAWLTNYLETYLLNNLWMPISSASSAYALRNILQRFADETDLEDNNVEFKASDFSLRGVEGMEAGEMSGLGHLTAFIPTSNLQSIVGLKEYYDWSSLYASSIPATEHSVVMVSGQENELESIKQLLLKYPKGNISILIDTWDYFEALEKYIPKLKEIIESREGKVVIRPDSGDRVEVVLAALKKLANVFGWTETKEGFKKLNPKVGVIYGEGISLQTVQELMNEVKSAGYATTNITVGVGSKMYQSLSRDTLGIAFKTSYTVIDGVEREVQKLATEFKTSPKGLLHVNEDFELTQGVDWHSHNSNNKLQPLVVEGKLTREIKFSEIKEKIWHK